jgi:hypothetical protein
MTTATIPQAVGDWNTKGFDVDTLLVLPIHRQLIDADRLARFDFNNGFPNWELFRTVYCGDNIYLPKLKQWVHEFAIAHCLEGGIKRQVYTPTLAGVAGLDALYLLIYMEPLLPHTVAAKDLGVKPETYKRLRDAIRDRLSVSVNTYLLHLGAAYRQVLISERKWK